MKITSLSLLFLTALILFTACKKEKICPEEKDKDLVLTRLSTSVSSSSKVKAFFRVSTKDGNPVPNLRLEDFSVFEKAVGAECHDSISRFEANYRFDPNPQRFHHSTFLVLDFSASITQSALAELKTASASFIQNVMPDTSNPSFQMSIWWFDGSDSLFQLQGFTSQESVLLDAISTIPAIPCYDCNSTRLFGATKRVASLAIKQYEEDKNIYLPSVAVALFTDGNNTAGGLIKDAIDALNNARTSTSNNFNIFTVGLGQETKLQDLKTLGQDGFIFATNNAQLKESFDKIAQRVIDVANSYYAFEYCSPKREGEVSVLIQATNTANLKGSFSFEFDAAVFAPPFNCQ